MQFDWAHLATAIKAARDELGYTQAELAAHAGVSEETIKNLEGRRQPSSRWPASADLVERALEKPAGWARAIARHEPTESREQGGAGEATQGNGVANGAPEPLPLSVEFALGEGRLLGYEVVSFDVEGEPVTIVTIARTGVSSDEHKREVLRAQLETLGRIKGHILREAEAAEQSEEERDES